MLRKTLTHKQYSTFIQVSCNAIKNPWSEYMLDNHQIWQKNPGSPVVIIANKEIKHAVEASTNIGNVVEVKQDNPIMLKPTLWIYSY